MGYKVVYFNGRGRAEVCRLILAYAGQEYEDVRMEREQWNAHKAETPFGQLPYLEIDGKRICQSNAMARYLAKKFGLYGSNELEAAEIDMLVDCAEDMLQPLMTAMFRLKSDEDKEEAKKKFQEEQFPEFCGKFESILASNGGKYLLGDKLTWADIQVAQALTWPEHAGTKLDAAKCPKLAAMSAAVFAEPKIAAWIAKRPETAF